MKMSDQLHINVALHPGKKVPSAHWIGGWVDPRAEMGTVKKEKSLATAENRMPRIQLAACHYTD
jgi:hypothetical protein